MERVREASLVDMRPARHRSLPRRARIGPLIALLLLVNLAASLYQLPLNRVVERRLCREFYLVHDPSVLGDDGFAPEELCKGNEIQQGLAWMLGVMETMWIVGDFVMTIPLGFVAERYGQRVVLWLNLVSRIFMLAWAVIVGFFHRVLPTEAILAGPVLSVLGGDCVFNSVTYALAAGMTDDHVVRASYFGYMSSVTYIVALLGPALAASTMSLLLWLPFFLGIALLLLAIPAIARLYPPVALSTPMATPPASSSHDEATQPLLSFPAPKDIEPRQTWLRAVAGGVRTLRDTIMSHPRNFSLLLVSFVLTSLASSDTKLLVQYISKRYGWSFASAGYLLSGKAVVNFVLLTVVVPRLLHRSRSSRAPVAPDVFALRYAQVCLAVSVIGALAIALAATVWILVPGLLVYALGSALPIFTFSLLKSPYVCPSRSHQDDDGRPGSAGSGNPTGQESDIHIFSIVMMVKTLGSLLGAPTMTVVWVWGIAVGGAALGMPYFLSSCCYVAAMGVLKAIDLR